MASIEEVLSALDPPLKHECEMRDRSFHLSLSDPTVPTATVERSFAKHELENSVTFQVVLLYAVNQLRGMGSHVPLEVLPAIDPPEGLNWQES
ncbi:hypothetical protein [Pseudomonas sp. UBA4194]|jgi:hypothetical protein|uniref:hypothetical protein n=1 Tax=Pseudomonas sp. UBA4194 TaxID=1947317 RepID=UPI0025F91B84|nr:hypothetical protein [Pseudomonas sp. UBA4194]